MPPSDAPPFTYSPPHSTEGMSRGNQQECLLLYEKAMTAQMVTTEDLRSAVTEWMRRQIVFVTTDRFDGLQHSFLLTVEY